MDKTEYDRIITDFYAKTFLEISLREGVSYATKDTGKIFNQFVDSFNHTLASNFLTKLDQTYPGLEDKVANYPEHFWGSTQGDELLREKLHQLSGRFMGHDNQSYAQFGVEPASFSRLNLAKFIQVSLQVGKEEFVGNAIEEFVGNVKYFENHASLLAQNEHGQKHNEKVQRNIRELKASIEWDLNDPKNTYSSEVKEALRALQMRLDWNENKEKNEAKADNRKPKL